MSDVCCLLYAVNIKLQCGPMPNVILWNIGGALCCK